MAFQHALDCNKETACVVSPPPPPPSITVAAPTVSDAQECDVTGS